MNIKKVLVGFFLGLLLTTTSVFAANGSCGAGKCGGEMKKEMKSSCDMKDKNCSCDMKNKKDGKCDCSNCDCKGKESCDMKKGSCDMKGKNCSCDMKKDSKGSCSMGKCNSEMKKPSCGAGKCGSESAKDMKEKTNN